MMRENLTIHEKNYRTILRRSEAEKFESLFVLQSATYELPSMEPNYLFDLPDTRMELDFAHVQTKVGVEIQGGIFNKTRMGHSTGKGIERDIHKINSAQMKGWLVILLTPQMANDGSGALLVKKAIQMRLSHAP